LETVDRHLGGGTRRALVYAGDAGQSLHDVAVLGWRDLVRAG
jgi:hypothetical protein